MAKSFILDPLWITQGSSLDSEYCTYVLLDASVKYKKELSKGKLNRFYEVLFHSLNLNNLAVNGNLFTPRFKTVWNNEKIEQIREDLKKLYDVSTETADIFKNANFVFLNILLEHTNIHLDILDSIRLFYMNNQIHKEKEIFIIINRAQSTDYVIWKLEEDSKKDFGVSFKKIKAVKFNNFNEKLFQEEINMLADPKLERMSGKKNVFFAILQEDDDVTQVAHTIKDLVILNKGLARDYKFEATLVEQLHALMLTEKILPFTLDQWNFEHVKEL